MKKPKVILVKLSPEKEDGSRDTVSEDILCTCRDLATANIILDGLRKIHAYEYNFFKNRRDIEQDKMMIFTSIKE